jgi:hypothetical protein
MRAACAWSYRKQRGDVPAGLARRPNDTGLTFDLGDEQRNVSIRASL